jgi:hypothetical protein
MDTASTDTRIVERKVWCKPKILKSFAEEELEREILKNSVEGKFDSQWLNNAIAGIRG